MLTLCVKEPGWDIRKVCLACGTHTIGRGKDNNVVLSDNDVSNTHARITCEDNRFFIEEMTDTGGVYLDDEQIGEKCRLENGSTLKIGGTTIQVSLLTSYETKTMVIFSPDEDTTLPLKNDTNSESNVEGGRTCVMAEDKISISKKHEATQKETIPEFVDHNGMNPQNKAKVRPKKQQKGGKKTLTLAVTAICIIMVALLYLQYNFDLMGLIKSKPKKSANGISAIEQPLVAQPPVKRTDDAGSDQNGAENLESNQIASVNDDAATEYMGKEKENEASYANQPSGNDDSKANQLIRQGLAYYIKGKVEESLREFDKIESLDLQGSASFNTSAATYRQMIDQARTLYHEGEMAYKQDHPEAAFQVWARVLKIDHHLVGQKGSHFSNSISEYMCSEYAKRARRAFNNADYEAAYKNCLKALTIKPGLQSAIDIKNRLSKRAEKLYGEAYILEELDPETAIRKWREILTISGPDNKFHKKASSQLSKY